MLSIKNRVYLITSIFFVLSCITLFLSYSLNVVLVTELVLFVFVLKYKNYSEWSIMLFWLCFILSEIFLVFSENPLNTIWPTLFKLFGYVMLCLCGFFKQKTLRISYFEYLIYGLLIFLNTYVVRAIIAIIEPFIILEYLVNLYFLLGCALIIVAAFAIRYRLIKDSRSKYFALLVLFLTCAEVTSVIAHYLQLMALCYLEYFFFLFGLSFCALFSVLENKNDKAFKLVKVRGV